MSTALAHAYAGNGGQEYDSVVRDSVDQLTTYLNNRFDHTWYEFSFGETGVVCSDYSQDDAGEEAFVQASMKAIDKIYGLFPYDNVVIAHECIGFGYGGGEYTVKLDGGGTATGHAVYAGSYVNDWEVRGFTWHELCHTFGAAHRDGDYEVTTDDLMYDITPMGMSYLHDETGEPDTQYSATWNGGDTPDRFCFSWDKNFAHKGYRDPIFKGNSHDLNNLSYCTRKKVEDWI